MNLKKIGISLRVETNEKYNEKRDTVSHDWINLFQKFKILNYYKSNFNHKISN